MQKWWACKRSLMSQSNCLTVFIGLRKMACPNPPKIDDPVTDNGYTVHFNFKYSQSVFDQSESKGLKTVGKTACDIAQSLQEDLTKSIFPYTSYLYSCHEKRKKIRFVVSMEQVAHCVASFHLTTDSPKDANFVNLFENEPHPSVMMISIKGRITEESDDWLTKSELYDIYSTILGVLSGPDYGLSLQNILVDRIEMIGHDESELLFELIQQNPLETKRKELTLMLKKELERKERKLKELESQMQRLQQQVEAMTSNWCPPSTESSLTGAPSMESSLILMESSLRVGTSRSPQVESSLTSSQKKRQRRQRSRSKKDTSGDRMDATGGTRS